MTPRSRKPVIFGALRDIAADNYHKNFVDFELTDNQNSDDYRCNMDADPLNASLQRSKSESSLLLKTPGTPDTALAATGEASTMAPINAKSTSDETLSTPFRWAVSLVARLRNRRSTHKMLATFHVFTLAGNTCGRAAC